jgi:hypothetical protein
MWKGWPFDCWSCCNTDSKICPNISENTENMEQKLARNSWGRNHTIARVTVSTSDSIPLKTKSAVDRNVVRKDSTLKTTSNRSLRETHKANSNYTVTSEKILELSDTSKTSQSMSNLNHSHSSSNRIRITKQLEIGSKVVHRPKDAKMSVGTSIQIKSKLDINKSGISKHSNKQDASKHIDKLDITKPTNKHTDNKSDVSKSVSKPDKNEPDINKLDTSKHTNKPDIDKPITDLLSTTGNLLSKQRSKSSLPNSQPVSSRTGPLSNTNNLQDGQQRRSTLSTSKPISVRSKETNLVSTTPIRSNRTKEIPSSKGAKESYTGHHKVLT